MKGTGSRIDSVPMSVVIRGAIAHVDLHVTHLQREKGGRYPDIASCLNPHIGLQSQDWIGENSRWAGETSIDAEPSVKKHPVSLLVQLGI